MAGVRPGPGGVLRAQPIAGSPVCWRGRPRPSRTSIRGGKVLGAQHGRLGEALRSKAVAAICAAQTYVRRRSARIRHIRRDDRFGCPRAPRRPTSPDRNATGQVGKQLTLVKRTAAHAKRIDFLLFPAGVYANNNPHPGCRWDRVDAGWCRTRGSNLIEGRSMKGPGREAPPRRVWKD